MLFNRRRYLIELFHVIVIISILVMIAGKSYQVFRAKAHVMGMISRFASAKTGNMMYLALHGEFPQNAEQALALLPPETPYGTAAEMKVVIEQGAVHVSSTRSHGLLAGKTLTMRPVVQDDDPAGAVHWVCGNKRESGWKVFGVDRTDIEDRHIPAVLK